MAQRQIGESRERNVMQSGGLICVAIGKNTVTEAIAAAQIAAVEADVVEIRIDAMVEPEVEPLLSELDHPMLFTCRPDWEGGLYTGPEEERLALLEEAVAHGAAFVDLELKAPDDSFSRLLPKLADSPTRLIVSNHNFEATGSREELLEILKAMKEKGADIGKIITTAHTFSDVLRVLQLQQDARELDLPLIAFCMGRAGVVSRLATLELGGFMTYCAPNDGAGTAPGQITVSNLRRALQALSLS